MTKKEALAVVAREFFQTGLAVYVVLALAETLSRGSVSDYFDMNYLLGCVIVAGVLLVWCGSFAGLLYRRGEPTEAESTNWANARNLRNLRRDRSKRPIRPLRKVQPPVSRRMTPHPMRAKSKTIDGVIRK